VKGVKEVEREVKVAVVEVKKKRLVSVLPLLCYYLFLVKYLISFLFFVLMSI
jgi:hypothetical protein